LAELQAKIASQKRRQNIARQELEVKQQYEDVDLQEQVELANAKVDLLAKYEEHVDLAHVKVDPFANEEQVPDPNVLASDFRLSKPCEPRVLDFDCDKSDHDSHDSDRSLDSAAMSMFRDIFKKQNEITESLLKQSLKSTLPTREISIFRGDPLEYRLFIRAFEHGVVDKSDSYRDYIYYLEQYTSGEPRELVRSCLHMDPKTGYERAMELLKNNFGDEYRISTSFVEKAMKWPNIKSEDPAGLKGFSLFLTGCLNSMKDIDYLKELNHPKNLKELSRETSLQTARHVEGTCLRYYGKKATR
jgi:hypothetical protein